ncbi:hypothetical protein Ga0074115_10469 [endosymbiont of Ridgeia piscesae]|jgi:predicted peptidase|uniref:Lipoprotein n=3 Tax=endosymbiont of Ridgeia piscesae TaxID=54398 RepID=A0A0T5YUK4_9GAMM|nr:hypothetical protein Ga0074115_10469 [endosymbiont of Ridgeia piscesae]KRT60300.1 hypothetical protein Ga0076813_16933 [endosymbiont of Ridgeia piscesae]
MMYHKALSGVLAGSLALMAGCASQPEEVSAAYVSPVKYMNYDCEQITFEMDHVSKRTLNLYRKLKDKADSDAVQMGVGLVLFWPALLFLEGGDGPEAVEYANLKGEFEALRSTAREKHCSMASLPPSPEEIIQKRAEEEKASQQQQNSIDV